MVTTDKNPSALITLNDRRIVSLPFSSQQNRFMGCLSGFLRWPQFQERGNEPLSFEFDVFGLSLQTVPGWLEASL